MSPSEARIPGDVLIHLRRAKDHMDRYLGGLSGNWMVLVEPRDYTPEDFEGVSMG